MMKIFKSIFCTGIAVALAASFAGCGSDGGDSNNGESGEKSAYTITVTQPAAGVTLSAPASAEEGETVTVTATIEADYYVESVSYDDYECEEVDGGWKFSMPAHDVTVTAETGKYEEKLSDGFMSFTGFIPDKFAVYENEFNAEHYLNFDFSKEVNISTDKAWTIASSDQDVIPGSALAVSFQGDGTRKTEGTVKIKTNDIQEGTTYITLTVKDDTTNESATVVKKVTVVKEDELTYETMKATLVFDLSALAGEKNDFLVQVSTENTLWGATNQTTYSKEVSLEQVGEKVTIEMDYIVGCSYRVTVFPNPYTGGDTYPINDWVGKGDSEAGFNQLKDGILTLITRDMTVELTARNN